MHHETVKDSVFFQNCNLMSVIRILEHSLSKVYRFFETMEGVYC